MNSFPISASFGAWRETRTLAHGAGKALSKAAETERRLDRTMLALEALWELVQERLDLSDDDLADRMLDIDARDGQVDNRRRSEPAVCSQCERVVSRRFHKCLYCGTPIEMDPFA